MWQSAGDDMDPTSIFFGWKQIDGQLIHLKVRNSILKNKTATASVHVDATLKEIYRAGHMVQLWLTEVFRATTVAFYSTLCKVKVPRMPRLRPKPMGFDKHELANAG